MSIRPIPEDLQEIARKKLNEDPARRQQDIEAIRQWLKKQPHLTSRLDDQWILTFLRGSKFSLERTKEKIDGHLTVKTLLPEFFRDRDPMRPELQELLNIGSILPLKPDDKGRAVFFIRNGDYTPKKHKLVDMLKLLFLSMDVTLHENDRATIAGDILIVDFKGVTTEHIMQMAPAVMKKATICYHEGYPFRPQAIYYVNAPSAFKSIIDFVKSLLKKKIQERIFVYGTDLTEFYKVINRDIMPEEYGGNSGPIAQIAAEFKKKIEGYRDWIIENEKYGSDEKKRPGKPKTSSDMFGMEGSFRTLTLD